MNVFRNYEWLLSTRNHVNININQINRFYFTYKSIDVEGRIAKIYQPSKNTMQSGDSNSKKWRLEFDVKQKWENSLIGWASGGDPFQASAIFFDTLDEAITFCTRQSIKYQVRSANIKKYYIRPYGTKFSWDKPTRSSTK